MRVLVVGAGAVGGYFGGRLAHAGKDITFLVRPHRAESLRREGLRWASPHGDATVHPRIVTPGEIGSPFDLLLLCVKAYSLSAALYDCAPAVGAGTILLPLLNGMRHLDALAERFGEDSVLGGTCLIAAEMAADGRIVQLTEIHRLIYGERRGGFSARTEAIDRLMAGALFEARAVANVLQDMWEKWVMLSSLGAVTCLLDGNIGEIAAVPGGAALARAMLEEASAIARASGYPPQESFLLRADKMLTTHGSTLTSSMYRDMTSGAPVEVEQILGDLIARGQALQVACPLLEAACATLRIYEKRRLG
jgi:2-dehydropantoate 2-reductase